MIVSGHSEDSGFVERETIFHFTWRSRGNSVWIFMTRRKCFWNLQRGVVIQLGNEFVEATFTEYLVSRDEREILDEY